MGLADAREHGVAFDTPARNRTIRHGRHALLAAGRDHLRLIEEWMHLDLVADEGLLRELYRLLDQRHGEIRYPDVAGKSQPLDCAERTQGLAQWNLRIGPVQQ